MQAEKENSVMIDIDIIRRRRGQSAKTGGTPSGSAGYGQSAEHAGTCSRAESAARADEATHAQSARELDGGSSVWQRIRDLIGNLSGLYLRKDTSDTADGDKYTFAHDVEVQGTTTMDAAEMGTAKVRGSASVEGDLDVDSSVSASNGVFVGDKVKLKSDGTGEMKGLTAGSVCSKDYKGGTAGGFDGAGFGLRKDGAGKYGLDIDNLTVRGKMSVSELDIHEITYVGGAVVLSPCGNRIDLVERYDAGGSAIKDGDTTTAVDFYRCYFLATDGSGRVRNEWTVGQLARCKTSNMAAPGSYANYENREYWRLCVGVSSAPVEKSGKNYHYIDLSNSESKSISLKDAKGTAHTVTIGGVCGTMKSEPMAGDKVAGMGHAWDESLANLGWTGVTGGNMGWVIYKGIDDYALPESKVVNKWTLNDTVVDTDHFVMRPYGSAGGGLSGGAIVEAYNKVGRVSLKVAAMNSELHVVSYEKDQSDLAAYATFTPYVGDAVLLDQNKQRGLKWFFVDADGEMSGGVHYYDTFETPGLADTMASDLEAARGTRGVLVIKSDDACSVTEALINELVWWGLDSNSVSPWSQQRIAFCFVGESGLGRGHGWWAVASGRTGVAEGRCLVNTGHVVPQYAGTYKALKAVGIDMDSETMTLTADKTRLQNRKGELVAIFDADGNVTCGSLKCQREVDGRTVTVEVSNGMVKALNGKAGVVIGIDDSGIPCLIGTDEEGKVLWRLGQRYETHGDDNFNIVVVAGSTYAHSKGETQNGNAYVGIGGQLTISITNNTNQAVTLTRENVYARMISKGGVFEAVKSGGPGTHVSTGDGSIPVGGTGKIDLSFGRVDKKGSGAADATGYSGGKCYFVVNLFGKDYTPLGSEVTVENGGTFFGSGSTMTFA